MRFVRSAQTRDTQSRGECYAATKPQQAGVFIKAKTHFRCVGNLFGKEHRAEIKEKPEAECGEGKEREGNSGGTESENENGDEEKNRCAKREGSTSRQKGNGLSQP